MSENVRKIREDAALTVEVPAIGCSFTTNLGGDRQIVLQTHIAGDMPDDIIDAVLDRILRAGDRQKAKYDLEKLEEEFRTVGVALTNLVDGFPIAERNHAKEQVERAETIAALREQISSIRDTAYEDFTNSGKRGTFRLVGHAEANSRRVQGQIDSLLEREKSAEADKAQHRETLLKSVVHYRQDIAKRRAKLNALRAIAGLGPNTEFVDAETSAIQGL